MWTDTGDAVGRRYAQSAQERDIVWILDVDGARILILLEATGNVSEAEIASMSAIVEGMQPHPAP
jgi:hypothetical protein